MVSREAVAAEYLAELGIPSEPQAAHNLETLTTSTCQLAQLLFPGDALEGRRMAARIALLTGAAVRDGEAGVEVARLMIGLGGAEGD